jgi:hypothetical protein
VCEEMSETEKLFFFVYELLLILLYVFVS